MEVPIVMLTAHATEADKEVCIKAGADDFLTKPVNLQTLKELVTRIPVAIMHLYNLFYILFKIFLDKSL